MRKRRTADEIARLLREFDRDLAKGLTISDICRKVGIAETTYYRWRQQHDPAQVDTDRRLGTIDQYNLQPNFYNTLLQEVAAVSPAQIHALIKTELDPQNEVLVVLGDKSHLEKAFSDAGIKDVKLVEPDYGK